MGKVGPGCDLVAVGVRGGGGETNRKEEKKLSRMSNKVTMHLSSVLKGTKGSINELEIDGREHR